jgi:hypothetical protein
VAFLDRGVTMGRRVAAVLFIILGLPVLYFDWVFIRRPVEGKDRGIDGS